MFYHMFYPLSSDYSIFNVFRYITFRSAYSGLTALALSLLFIESSGTRGMLPESV